MVMVDATEVVAAFTVRHKDDGALHYNGAALNDAKENARDSDGQPDRQETDSSVAPVAGVFEFSCRPLDRVNLATGCKVIDPDTGERIMRGHARRGCPSSPSRGPTSIQP
jgi:hypothetical protein